MQAADVLQQDRDKVQQAHEALKLEHAALSTQHLATCDQLKRMSEKTGLGMNDTGGPVSWVGKESGCSRCRELTDEVQNRQSQLDETNKRVDVAKKQLAFIVSRHQAQDKHAANQLLQALESQRAAEQALADRDAHVATLMEQAEDMKIQVCIFVCMTSSVCACTIRERQDRTLKFL